MSKIFLIVLVIIVIICVIYYFVKSKPIREYYNKIKNKYKDKYLSEPEDLYKKIIGYEKDETVNLLLSKALNKEQMYDRNSIYGMSPENIKNSIKNSFILADIYRFNISTNDKNYKDYNKNRNKALLYYNKTINKIMNNPVVNIDNNIPPGHMIDRIENFYNELNNEITTPIEYLPDFNSIRDTIRTASVIHNNNRIVNGEVRQGKETIFTKNKPKKKFIKTDYYKNVIIPNDPQNVHNSQVSHDIKTIYNAIKEKNGHTENMENNTENEYTIKDIETDLKNFSMEPDKKMRALEILNSFNNNSDNSVLEDNERNIITNVYKRINDNENSNNINELKSSFFNSLSDCMEKNSNGEYKQVCSSGKCNRVIQSLTLLDNDDTIKKPIKTVELLKSEIFSKSHKIINDELDKLPEKVKNVYNGIEISTDSSIINQVEHFQNEIKDILTNNIELEYRDITNPNILDNIIKETLAGIN